MTLIGGILLVVTVLLWAAVAVNTATLNSSDPAGNSLSYAYGVFMVIGLWLLLAVLIILAGVRGGMPPWARLAAIILVPASGAATLGAMSLMAGHAGTRWPLIIPVLAPALLIGYAFWRWFPALGAAIPSTGANVLVWGGLLLISLAPLPWLMQRSREGTQPVERVQAAGEGQAEPEAESRRQENLANFKKLTQASRLQEWMAFTGDENELRDQALEGARRALTRQADAEEMLANGHHFPLVEVSSLNLQATPALCARARALLIRHAEDLGRVGPNLPDYDARAAEFTKFIGSMAWLKSNGCSIDDALDALEAGASAFTATPSRTLFLEAIARLRRAQ